MSVFTRPKLVRKKSPYQSVFVGDVVVTPGAVVSTVMNVAFQLRDGKKNLTHQGWVDGYLSDNADGSTLAASAPSGGLATGTNGLCIESVSDKLFKLISNSTGAVDINITQSSTKTFYLVLLFPDGYTLITPIIFP